MLGLKGVFFLDHRDGELVADLRLKKEIVSCIRKLKPEIVVTWDPTPFYSKSGFINHTDHRAAGEAAIDAVYPLARDRLAFEELGKAGLAPHKVKTLYLGNMDNWNELVDISGTISTKLKAISCHKSQVSKGTLESVKKSSRWLGKKKGYKYAEAFVKLSLQ